MIKRVAFQLIYVFNYLFIWPINKSEIIGRYYLRLRQWVLWNVGRELGITEVLSSTRSVIVPMKYLFLWDTGPAKYESVKLFLIDGLFLQMALTTASLPGSMRHYLPFTPGSTGKTQRQRTNPNRFSCNYNNSKKYMKAEFFFNEPFFL